LLNERDGLNCKIRLDVYISHDTCHMARMFFPSSMARSG
jgi:hypothetical protein